MELDIRVLAAVLVILPSSSACNLYGNIQNSVSGTPNITIQNSSLQLTWDFQNDILQYSSSTIQLQIYYGCVNTSTGTVEHMQSNNTVASSSVLLNIIESNFTTHCEACIQGYIYTGSKYNKILNTKVTFSFGTYCANRYYNISSSSQTVCISQGEGACFVCTLPGQSRSDIWKVNGQDVAQYSNAVGALIVANTSTLFGDPTMTSTLTCGNNEYNMTVLIIYARQSIQTITPTSVVPSLSIATRFSTYQELPVESPLIPTPSNHTELPVESTMLPHYSALAYEDILPPVFVAVVLITFISCLVLFWLGVAIKRQSKYINARDMFQLKMVLQNRSSISKILSISSITTQLDKLEVSVQVECTSNLNHSHSYTVHEDVENDSSLPSYCTEKSAFYYDGRTAGPVIETITQPNNATILESHLQNDTPPTCTSENSPFLAIEEFNNPSENFALRQSGNSEINTDSYSSDVKGYVASPQQQSAHYNKTELFVYVDQTKWNIGKNCTLSNLDHNNADMDESNSLP